MTGEKTDRAHWGTGPDSTRRIAFEIEVAMKELQEDPLDGSTGWDRLASVIKRLRQTVPRTSPQEPLNVCSYCDGAGTVNDLPKTVGDRRRACGCCVTPYTNADDLLGKDTKPPAAVVWKELECSPGCVAYAPRGGFEHFSVMMSDAEATGCGPQLLVQLAQTLQRTVRRPPGRQAE